MSLPRTSTAVKLRLINIALGNISDRAALAQRLSLNWLFSFVSLLNYKHFNLAHCLKLLFRLNSRSNDFYKNFLYLQDSSWTSFYYSTLYRLKIVTELYTLLFVNWSTNATALLYKLWYFIYISTGNLYYLLGLFILICNFILYNSVSLLRICLVKNKEL